MRKYRIVADLVLGYGVQVWRWWWPFWVMPQYNTHSSVEDAEAWAIAHARRVAKHLGEL